MKKIRAIFVTFTLLSACTEGGEPVRDALSRRIDWTGSTIELRPAAADLVRATKRVELAPDIMIRELNGGPTRIVRIDKQKGTFEIRDTRGYDEDVPTLDPDLDRIYADTAVLLASIGVAPEEIGEQHVRGLGASEREDVPGAKTIERRIATKVFVERAVAGLPVEGERLVLSFTNGRDFRKMLGRWRTIDYRESRLVSKLSPEEFKTVALESLEKLGVETDSDQPIRLGTRYAVETRADGTHVLVLRGYAIVPLQGPGGSYKESIHEFPI